MDRRALLVSAAALALHKPQPRIAPVGRTRLILLGTAGGPRPRKTRAAPALVILVDTTAYVVDCGNGVARQLVLADIPLASIRHILLTHHHSDHNADYGTLLSLAWTAGLRSRLDSWGPPPLVEMTRQYLAMSAADLEVRVADEGRPPLSPLLFPHELLRAGVVFEADGVRVSAVPVHHPPVVPAFGYRFDTPDRSIVVSGDTTPTESLVELARGADVLVHEAIYPSAIDRLTANVPNAPTLKQSILAHHTTAEEAGRIAAKAGVKTLVLSHLIPAEDPEVTDERWLAAAGAYFSGTIIVGRDLLEI